MENSKNKKAPYTVVILDLLDAYHFADVFDENRYKILSNNFVSYEGCVKLADRLFWALNPEDKTQEDWCEMDDGWDVQVYNADFHCVYKAHEKLPEK